MSFPDLAAMRARYRAGGLTEADLAADPFQQFAHWFTDAVGAGLPEPNAMVVSTTGTDGRPGSRTVLLKGYDADGFVFYTNYDSRKGHDLAATPYASLLFPWHPIARQVIVSGEAVRVGRDETVAYFRSRPHGSQLGAWASAQSTPVASRAELERRYAELADRYPEDDDAVPAPPFWGGYRLVPDRVEFWQGRDNRLHDRLVYERGPVPAGTPSAGWTVTRLCP
jgi:pyridoxamine 5'-phosphate oxidase